MAEYRRILLDGYATVVTREVDALVREGHLVERSP